MCGKEGDVEVWGEGLEGIRLGKGVGEMGDGLG